MNKPLTFMMIALLWLGATEHSIAQNETSAILPITPQASLCVGEPRPESFFAPLVAQLFATPAAEIATNAATPVVPRSAAELDGVLASTEIEAEIVDAVIEGIACNNANDVPRLTALLTEAAARRTVLEGFGVAVQESRRSRFESGDSEPTADAILNALSTAGGELPQQHRSTLRDVRDVRVLPDGRITAVIVTSTQAYGDRRTQYVFVREDGDFLLDQFAALPTAEVSTPIP